MKNKIRRNDIILIAVILVIALVCCGGIWFYRERNTSNAVAVVTVGGKEYGRYALDVDITERIELPDGSYNVLEIREGRADITEASCPDKICVDHRPVSKNTQTIVCLPNEVVIEIENGEESGVDSVAN